MRAQNLTISVPYKGCDKDCPYCVSKMTGYMDTDDDEQFYWNMVKARTVAKAAQVSSILITGKGEPTLNKNACERIGEVFSEFPIEMQTNGISMLKNWTKNKTIFGSDYLSTVAFSIDSLAQWKELSDMMKFIRKYGMLVRATLNLTDKFSEDFDFGYAIELAKETNVHQLSFRNIVVPKGLTEGCIDVIKWITEHKCAEAYQRVIDQFSYLKDDARVLRTLPFGAVVYDFEGIAVTMFDECVQSVNHNEDIRSLIYQEDGHMYTSWDSPASILF